MMHCPLIRPLLSILCAAFLAASVLCLSGCTSGGKVGATWWNPTTWGSHSEASATDKATARRDTAAEAVDTAREKLLREAQTSAHTTDLALVMVSADARPVEIARTSSASTVAALDQAVGALPVEEAARLRKLVADLTSDNADIRAAAEVQQRDASARLERVSADLQNAQTRLADRETILAAKQAELRAAFDRENKLANAHRNLLFGFWGLAGLALVILILGAILRSQLGGVGGALAALKAREVNVAPIVSELDKATSWLGQHLIFRARVAAERSQVHAETAVSASS